MLIVASTAVSCCAQNGLGTHELGANVPQLFEARESVATFAASSRETTSAAAVSCASAGLPTLPALGCTATLRALNKQYLHAYIDVLSALASPAVPVPGAHPDAASSVAVEAALKRVSDISVNLSYLLT